MAYSFGDISSTVEKMPTPCEGRGLWMDKLAELTTGVTLALGDFRAIAQTMMSRAELQEIEGSAKTLILPDHTRFTALWTEFPLPVSTGPPKYMWDPTVFPREHLKCKEDWTRQTGVNPSQPDVQQQWYRRGVEEGLPNTVQQALNGNPDLPGSEATVWERHVVHHMNVRKQQPMEPGTGWGSPLSGQEWRGRWLLHGCSFVRVLVVIS